MRLWTSEGFEKAARGQGNAAFRQSQFDIGNLVIDSREIEKGDAFFALKAARDGHEFVLNALKAGASCAVVSHIPKGAEDLPLLLVDDVEAALRRCASHRRSESHAKILAVTGSAGKTSTKEMLKFVLSQFGKTHASVKSFNNHWGVPLSLARMPHDCEFAIFEIGMNHPGEIAPLAQMVAPDIAIITNIAAVHLAGFDDERGIAEEKASILFALSEQGLGIVKAQDEYRDIFESYQKPLWYFGESENDAIVISQIELSELGSKAEIAIEQKPFQLQLSIVGIHHLQNAAAVLGAVYALGLDVARAAEILKNWQPPEGRGERFEYENFIIFDESYNANPLSMRAALESFIMRSKPRRVAFLGDMAELGAQSEKFHQDIARYESLKAIDERVLIGPKMQALFEIIGQNATHYDNVQQAIANLSQHIQTHDEIFIKASNGTRLGELVDALKKIGQKAGNL